MTSNGVSQVSLPKFIDVDWRVDVKTASSDARSLEPVALINLRVRNRDHSVSH